MLSNQKSSRSSRVRAVAFFAITLALLMNVTAFASGNSRFAFIDTAAEFFGLQTAAAKSNEITVTTPFGTATVSLPATGANAGAMNVAVPITVSDLSSLMVISYDLNVDYDQTKIVPASPAFTQAGTLSAGMSVTPNTGNPGHFIISAFQGVPLGAGTTLLILNFNVVGASGFSPLAFADYTDPGPAFHPGFVFNEGTPVAAPSNGIFNIVAATPTFTDTPTPSATNTNTATNTATATGTATETFTPTPSSTATNTSTPTPTPQCAQIDIEDETTTSGSAVTLSVTTSVTNVLTPPAYSADFRISYDNTILAGVPTSPYGVALGAVALANNSQLTVNRVISGSTTTLYISIFEDGISGPFTLGGELVTIFFPTVTGGAGTFTPVNFTGWPQVPAGFWYNEGFPSTCLQNGSVQILGTVSGNILYDNTMPGAPFTRPVPQVQLSSSGSGFPAVSTVFSDTLGNYTLSGFGTGVYNVVPFRSEFSAPNTQGAAVSAFDAAITAQKVVELITFTSRQNFVANVTNTGLVSSFDSAKMAQWAVGLIGSAPNDTGKWRFSPSLRTYVSAGSLTGENYLAYLMGDPSGNWCDPTTSVTPCSPSGTVVGQPRAAGPHASTVVTARNVSAPAGGTVVVPVNVERAADKGIISYQFDLRYDPTVIQPTANAVTLGGTVSSQMSVVFNPVAPGMLRVAVYGPYAINENGLMLNFNFTAIGDAFSSSPLTFENFMFNEGGIATFTTNGRVDLTAAVPNTAAE